VKVSASAASARGKAVLAVTVDTAGAGRVAVARSDFRLAVNGDIFGVQNWNGPRSRIEVASGRSRNLRLTFSAPSSLLRHATLSYRSRVVPLEGSRGFARRPTAHRASTIRTFWTDGVGEPWGTALDGSGNVWFAEPGCDFAPTCAGNTPPGQIGKLDPSSGAFSLYTLPRIPGNQPIFVTFDSGGNLWFTTPNNSMIGQLDPSTGMIQQWPVTGGTGPWDLTFANGQIWYAEHLASAVGVFNPATHTHQDFPTPSGNSNPYGITASGGRIWFTENNSNVDRVAFLDTAQGNAIYEYPIVATPDGGTPHLIVMGPGGQPWWTEGWTNTIATLDPAAATPGSCGSSSGPCNGVHRFQVPPPGTCGGQSHTSGIAFDAPNNRVWLDNSLTAQVGSFTPATGEFAMTTLSDCNAHPHDGLDVDSAGNVWFDEEFADAIGELAGPPANPSGASGSSSTTVIQASTGSSATATIRIEAPGNTAAPTIRGVLRQGRTVTAEAGAWTHEPTHFSYRWQRCNPRCSNIANATGGSYRLRGRDVLARVRVVVTASNDGGDGQAKSHGRGPVGPSLKRVRDAVSQLLSASTKSWTISKLRGRGGYRSSFRGPSRGELIVAWHARSVRIGSAQHGASALVATARRHFSNRHAAIVTIQLTRVGRRLLERASKLTVAARVIFIPAGHRAVSSGRRVTLSSG
jgi:streptogramin lyase